MGPAGPTGPGAPPPFNMSWSKLKLILSAACEIVSDASKSCITIGMLFVFIF
jgi:hypothetical protein